jgi:hypothetical protein
MLTLGTTFATISLQGRNKNNQTITIDLSYNKRFVFETRIWIHINPNPLNPKPYSLYSKPYIASENLGTIERILRIKTCAVYELHACANECESFPFLNKSWWKDHLNDKCSICGLHRFKFLNVTAKASIPIPRRKFYASGISSAIKK